MKIYRLKAKGTPDGFLSGYLPFRQKVDIVDAVENRETVFKVGEVRRRMKCPGVSAKSLVWPLLFNCGDDNLFLTIAKAPEGLLSNLISQNLLEGETRYAPGRHSTETSL